MIIANGLSKNGHDIYLACWDINKCAFVKNFKIPSISCKNVLNECINSISFLGNEYLLASYKNIPYVLFYDLLNNKLVHKFKIDEPASILKASNDALFLAIAIKTRFEIWKVNTGKCLCRINEHYQNIECIQFTNDSCYLITAGKDSIINVWPLSQLLRSNSEDENLKVTPLYTWRDHTSAIKDIWLTQHLPGYKSRVLTISEDLSLKIYDLALNGKLLCSVIFPFGVTKICSDTLNTSIFIGSINGNIYRIDLYCKNPNQIPFDTEMVYEGHNSKIIGIRYLPKNLIISASETGTFKIWNVAIFRCLQTFDTKVTLIGFDLIPAEIGEHIQNTSKSQEIPISEKLDQISSNPQNKRKRNDKTPTPSHYKLQQEVFTTLDMQTPKSLLTTDEPITKGKKHLQPHSIYLHPNFGMLEPSALISTDNYNKDDDELIVVPPSGYDIVNEATEYELKTLLSPMDKAPQQNDSKPSTGGMVESLRSKNESLVQENRDLKARNKKLYTMAMSKVLDEL